MTKIYAQPYDITATGFFFESKEEYSKKTAVCRNSFDDPVEEFEIQFIDGEAIDAALCDALGLYQSNIGVVFDLIDALEDHQKRILVIAVGECGYRFDPETDDPDDFEVDLFEGMTMRELAEQFVDDGLFGDIPERLAFYIDFDAIARDLAVAYTETEIAGERLIYRCA